MTTSDPGARLRLRVIGSFTPSPSGRRWLVSATNLAEVMASAPLSAEVPLPSRLGDPGRTLPLSFSRPRAFQLSDVVAAAPPLAGLKALADSLADAQRAPGAESVITRARELVGEGELVRALVKALEPARPATAATGGTAAPEAQAVDGFVRSIRGSGGPASPARAARSLLEETVFAAAADVLADPRVAALESAWRGLKLLLDQCPPAASTAIEVVDTTLDGVVAGLERDLADDPFDRPDLYVVVDACDDVALFGQLADAAERLLAPVIVSLSPRFFGAADAADISARLDQEPVGLPDGWSALRAEDSTRWMCAVANRVVVAREGVGAARRVAFASPALALAALLTASFRETRSFARILGANGALEAPAAWELPSGREKGTSAPTEAFFFIRTQSALAKHGILGLGSGRNTTKLQLSEMPMVRESADAAPLSAQILTGRIVRFAEWVCGEVPAGSSDGEAASLFEEAAKVFLFAGLEEGAATLRAGVGKSQEGARMVEIACRLPAPLAGIPFQMAFALPLG